MCVATYLTLVLLIARIAMQHADCMMAIFHGLDKPVVLNPLGLGELLNDATKLPRALRVSLVAAGVDAAKIELVIRALQGDALLCAAKARIHTGSCSLARYTFIRTRALYLAAMQ